MFELSFYKKNFKIYALIYDFPRQQKKELFNSFFSENKCKLGKEKSPGIHVGTNFGSGPKGIHIGKN